MKYAYSPVTGELINTDVIADWMGTTEDVPPVFDPAVESCFRRGGRWEIEGITPLPPVVPQSVPMRQARLALREKGLYDAVNAFIAAIPGAEGDKARIEWEFATEVWRSNPLFLTLAGALELSDEQIDALFLRAAAL